MGAILDKTVQRAVGKGWIPSGDQQAVIDKMQALGSKYNFSPDDLAVAMHMESYGMDPKANNGDYFGVMQIGGSVMGEINTSKSDILSKSTLQQLDIVDRYFANRQQQNILPAAPDMAALYLSILWPAAAKETNFNKNLSPPVPKQADALYVDGKGGGGLTKNSIIAGLKKHAAANLGVPLGTSQAASPGLADSIAQSVNQSIQGLISSVFNGSCDEVFPLEYTMAEAIVYTGCYSKIASGVQAGQGLPYSAPGVGVIGASGQATALANAGPGVPLAPGSFALPSNCPASGSGGSFGACRPLGSCSRKHQGQDYACPTGSPIYATAAGTVTQVNPSSSGAGHYIEITHVNGATSRYLHLSKFQVAKGQTVQQGQQIALSGNTGVGSGPHLHFEIIQGGVAQNPTKLLKS